MIKQIFKKVALVLMLTTLFASGSLLSPLPVKADSTSICQLIEVLVLVDVIPANKANLARAAMNCSGSTVIDDGSTGVGVDNSNLIKNSNSSLEQVLRGPSTWSEANKVCRSVGKRLPTWEESIAGNINPSQFLTAYGHAFDSTTNRIWSSLSCGTGSYSTSWKGIPDVVRNGMDVRAKNSWDNCTDGSEKHYYQCAIGEDIIIDDDGIVVDEDLKADRLSYVDIDSEYDAGQTIKYSVKTIASNGLPGTPDKNFNVQAWIQTSSGESVQVNGVSQSVNATYNYNTKYWDVSMTAPLDSSKTYVIDTAFYCSRPNQPGGCVENQINKSHDFKVTSSTSIGSEVITSQQGWESDVDVLNPRLTFKGTEYVPFDDNATAAKFCTSVTDKSFTGGKLNQADAWVWNGVPNDSLKWDGQNWVVAKSLNYVRRIQCQK